MSKIKSRFRISAIVLVFGFFLVGCDMGGGGMLTLTNIPSRFNGKFIFLYGESRSREILGADSIDFTNETGTASRISNGRARIPVWIEEGDNFVRYAGSQTFSVEMIILNSASLDEFDDIAELEFDSITFSNGRATVSFQDAEFWEY